MKEKTFRYTWRWFGPKDRITLESIRQAGANGIVNALHQIPVGDVWTLEAIKERKAMIEAAGLTWDVVESLPVSEDIKKQIGNYKQHIANYKISMENLAQCGIQTICYNFMPVLDWSRTNLTLKYEDGSESLGYQYIHFVAFDLFILKREAAQTEYSDAVKAKAEAHFNSLDEAGKKELHDIILLGLPGSGEAYTLDQFRAALKTYDGFDKAKMRRHLVEFLQEIIPVAEKNGIKMAIHPDDPPWALLGMPRVVGNIDDLMYITEAVPSPSNGITLCTGSLGAGHFNNLSAIAAKLAPKVNFAHLRNVACDADLNFHEDYLFDGNVDMYEVTKTLVLENQRRIAAGQTDSLIPMRPDHGHQILEDIGKENYPGYGLYGRMKNLAELKGLTVGIERSLGI